jgi:hypothetical protein
VVDIANPGQRLARHRVRAVPADRRSMLARCRSSRICPAAYEQFLSAIKERVRTARLRAVAAANQELLRGYWEIGNEILRRQQQEGWAPR